MCVVFFLFHASRLENFLFLFCACRRVDYFSVGPKQGLGCSTGGFTRLRKTTNRMEKIYTKPNQTHRQRVLLLLSIHCRGIVLMWYTKRFKFHVARGQSFHEGHIDSRRRISFFFLLRWKRCKNHTIKIFYSIRFYFSFILQWIKWILI